MTLEQADHIGWGGPHITAHFRLRHPDQGSLEAFTIRYVTGRCGAVLRSGADIQPLYRGGSMSRARFNLAMELERLVGDGWTIESGKEKTR